MIDKIGQSRWEHVLILYMSRWYLKVDFKDMTFAYSSSEIKVLDISSRAHNKIRNMQMWWCITTRSHRIVSLPHWRLKWGLSEPSPPAGLCGPLEASEAPETHRAAPRVFTCLLVLIGPFRSRPSRALMRFFPVPLGQSAGHRSNPSHHTHTHTHTHTLPHRHTHTHTHTHPLIFITLISTVLKNKQVMINI